MPVARGLRRVPAWRDARGRGWRTSAAVRPVDQGTVNKLTGGIGSMILVLGKEDAPETPGAAGQTVYVVNPTGGARGRSSSCFIAGGGRRRPCASRVIADEVVEYVRTHVRQCGREGPVSERCRDENDERQRVVRGGDSPLVDAGDGGARRPLGSGISRPGFATGSRKQVVERRRHRAAHRVATVLASVRCAGGSTRGAEEPGRSPWPSYSYRRVKAAAACLVGAGRRSGRAVGLDTCFDVVPTRRRCPPAAVGPPEEPAC